MLHTHGCPLHRALFQRSSFSSLILTRTLSTFYGSRSDCPTYFSQAVLADLLHLTHSSSHFLRVTPRHSPHKHRITRTETKQTENQSRVLQLILTKTLGCRKEKPKQLGTKCCLEEDGVCSWATCKILITAEMPSVKDVSPYNRFEALTKSTDNERCKICLAVTPLGNPM